MSPGALTVLYIDDDRNDLALMGMAIDRTDYDIWLYTVSSASQAIEFLEESRVQLEALHALPDVMLLDLRMPSMSGLDFLRWRQTSAFKWLPVAVLTSALSDRDSREALELGANKCIEKPSNLTLCIHLVAEVWDWGIQRRRGERSLNGAG